MDILVRSSLLRVQTLTIKIDLSSVSSVRIAQIWSQCAQREMIMTMVTHSSAQYAELTSVGLSTDEAMTRGYVRKDFAQVILRAESVSGGMHAA